MKAFFAAILCIAFFAGPAFAAQDLVIKEFELRFMATEKFGRDEAGNKVSQGMTLVSAGQTELTSVENGRTSLVGVLMLKTALSEINYADYRVQQTFAVFFPPEISGTPKGEAAEAAHEFRFEKDNLAALRAKRDEQQVAEALTADLTVKGLAALRKAAYPVTPEFERLFEGKIKQFVWSIHQQLPEIVLKLAQKHSETVKAGKK